MEDQGDAQSWELRGLALTAFGVQFSVFANSLVKTITTVPVVQAMQVRFLIQCCCTASTSIVLRRQGRPMHLLGKPGHRWLLLLRAICFAIALIGNWTALRLIPVGDSTTIVYLYPVFCGILANHFLKEPLGWTFWAQAGTCFSGVLLVTGAKFSQLDTSSYQQGVALAVFAAFCFASTNCCVRALKDAQPFEIQLFTDSLMAFLVMPCALLITGNAWDWSGWDFNVFTRLFFVTAFGLCALLIVLLGHQLAPASKATLFTYLEVPSAFVVQGLAFGDVLDLQQSVGVFLILITAAIRFWSEVSRSRTAMGKPLLIEEETLVNNENMEIAA